MMAYAGYQVNWLAKFLHGFPHIDIKFQTTNSTFNPDSKSYRESIGFLAAIPVLWCFLALSLISLCLCVHCCKQKPKKKRHTTCLRLITAVFIIFCIASLAVGFFGNEEGNKGVQSTVDALDDASDFLNSFKSTLQTLDGLTASINKTGIDTLEKVFRDHLKEAIRDDVMKLAEDIRNQALRVRKDIGDIRNDVSKINLEQVTDTTQKVEFWRWVGTIILFCWQLIVILVYIVGTLKKSKYCLVWGMALGFASQILAWAAAGIYLGGTVGLSDFCVAPDVYIAKQLEGDVPKDVIEGYLHCSTKGEPPTFSKALEDALQYVTKANDTLTEAINKTLPYNISQYMEGPVKVLRDDLEYARGNISSISESDMAQCGHIHTNYIKALAGICNRSLVGLGLILLILPIFGLSLIMVQCFTPRIWLLLGRRKGYHVVDDSDPFLPRPPPYNGYGAIGEDRTTAPEPVFLDDTVMTEPPRPASATSDSPPPAYYPGSFVEQYNNLGTFPRNSRPT